MSGLSFKVTPSTFAFALGGYNGTLSDFNSATNSGMYGTNNISQCSNRPTNASSGAILFVSKIVGTQYQQICILTEGDGMYRRYYDGSIWSEWTNELPPSFYKNYGNLSSLASALGVLTFENRTDTTGTSADANNVDDGLYFGNNFPSDRNWPTVAGMLLQITPVNGYKFQICQGYYNEIYIRHLWAGGSWNPWTKISGTTV